MDILMWFGLVVLALCMGFVLGAVFHKLVIDREQAIKDHISEEMKSLRLEFLAQAEHMRELLKRNDESLITKGASK